MTLLKWLHENFTPEEINFYSDYIGYNELEVDCDIELLFDTTCTLGRQIYAGGVYKVEHIGDDRVLLASRKDGSYVSILLDNLCYTRRLTLCNSTGN